MLRSLGTILGYTIHAVDGELGTVRDFLFEDQTWTVRYLVVETGSWLDQRRVLLSTAGLGKPEWRARIFPVSLSKAQVRNSPGIDTDAPVSRQQEIAMSVYYGWPGYWSYESPPLPLPEPPVTSESKGDPHLRSMREVRAYHARCADETGAEVDDFIADDQTWVIRWIVVAFSDWRHRKRVLVGTGWAGKISWDDREVRLRMNREQLEESPEFDPAAAVNREYEVRLYDYYGRPIDSGEAVSPPHAG